MKKYFFLAAMMLSALCMGAQVYQHSVGVNVGGINGLSYKGFIGSNEHLFITADLGVKLSQTQGVAGTYSYYNTFSGGVESDKGHFSSPNYKMLYWTLEANPNMGYQGEIADFGAGTICWFAGGGISLGMLQTAEGTGSRAWKNMKILRDEYKKDSNRYPYPYNFKMGVNALIGMELCLKRAPINIGIDFRPGWGEYFWRYKYSNAYYHETDNEKYSYAFFDWGLAASIRYRF